MSWLPRVAPKVNTKRPFIYLFQIKSPEREYRYVGKASNPARFRTEYQTNVKKILAKEPRCDSVTRNGTPQTKSNMSYRRVHLLLAIALEEGWKITHTAIENVPKANLNGREKELTQELNCDLNGQSQWLIRDYAALKQELMLEAGGLS